MRPKRLQPNPARRAEILATAAREREARAKGYRDRALALFPHVCARCGREFSTVRLRELTVHHKDHNHDNNPPDGSNWELLCLYCHDNEHQDPVQRDHYDGDPLRRDKRPALGYEAFEGLRGLLPPEPDAPEAPESSE